MVRSLREMERRSQTMHRMAGELSSVHLPSRDQPISYGKHAEKLKTQARLLTKPKKLR